MADQNTQFYAILTNVGAAKQANADALGIPWRITQLGVGDANGTEPTPNATQTRLINEWRRAPLNQLKVDDKNNAIVVAEQVIPADVGGKWIREIALYDADGDMIAVANCPPTFKPLLTQGSGRTQVVRMNLLVSSSSNVELKIDPAVVLATREYVDSRITEEISKLDNKQSVRVATTANIALAGLQVIDGVQLAAGDRVLVPKQAAARDNGLWVAAAGAWSRAPDADISAEVTPGMVVAVEQGATFADTIWQLITDGPIILGSTALTFRDITDGFARLLSPAFVGTPTAPTASPGTKTKQLATTEFAREMIESLGLGVLAYQPVWPNTSLNNCSNVTAGDYRTIASSTDMPPGFSNNNTVSYRLRNGADGAFQAVQLVISTPSNQMAVRVSTGGTSAAPAWSGWGISAFTDSPVFTGNPQGPTALQFDNDKSLATTEFVQRALGNYSGVLIATASASLVAAVFGRIVLLNGASAFTLTLPSSNAGVLGAAITLRNVGGAAVTLVPAAGDAISNISVAPVPSIVIPPGSSCDLVLQGNIYWFSGTAGLKYAAEFGASLTGTTGYQKLPSGDIEQWGVYVGAPSGADTVITLPVAMLAVPTCIELTFANFSNGENVGTAPVLQARNSTPGSITVRNLFAAQASFFWKVRGKV